MSIIEQLQEIAKEEEIKEKDNDELVYQMPTRAWQVYKYLKTHCVGEKKKQSAEKIVNYLKGNTVFDFGKDYDKRQLRSDIRKIRTTLPRRIGSSSSGYWLMTNEDMEKGTKLLESQFVSITETLVNLGINPKLLHEVVGGIGRKRGKELDNQGTLPIGNYLREVIHTLSDDLEKGE